MTRFIGLTGGIGAGKSEALAAASRLGAATISTDQVAHDVLESPEVRELLVERWGDEVIGAGRRGRPRADLGDRLRATRTSCLARVRRPTRGWARRRRVARGGRPETEVAVLEIPLLFEAGLEAGFDETVAVIAADEIRERPPRRARAGRPRGPRGAPAEPGREGLAGRPRDPQRRHDRGAGAGDGRGAGLWLGDGPQEAGCAASRSCSARAPGTPSRTATRSATGSAR